MDVSIRRVLLGDAPVLAALARQTFYDTFTGTCTEKDMQDFLEEYFNETQLGKEISNEKDFCYFCEVNGQSVGYIRFMEDYHSFPQIKQWKALELKRLYVLNEYKGKGTAQHLMNVFFDFANLHQYEVVWLGVWEHNKRAQNFYLKYGFKPSGYTHDFPIGSTPQTDQWFWKFL